jgi:hypothetical protein
MGGGGGRGVLSVYRWIRCFLATMRWTLETELWPGWDEREYIPVANQGTMYCTPLHVSMCLKKAHCHEIYDNYFSCISFPSAYPVFYIFVLKFCLYILYVEHLFHGNSLLSTVREK